MRFPAHLPLIAAHAAARMGALVSDFSPGPTSLFDLGNALTVRCASIAPGMSGMPGETIGPRGLLAHTQAEPH